MLREFSFGIYSFCICGFDSVNLEIGGVSSMLLLVKVPSLIYKPFKGELCCLVLMIQAVSYAYSAFFQLLQAKTNPN